MSRSFCVSEAPELFFSAGYLLTAAGFDHTRRIMPPARAEQLHQHALVREQDLLSKPLTERQLRVGHQGPRRHKLFPGNTFGGAVPSLPEVIAPRAVRTHREFVLSDQKQYSTPFFLPNARNFGTESPHFLADSHLVKQVYNTGRPRETSEMPARVLSGIKMYVDPHSLMGPRKLQNNAAGGSTTGGAPAGGCKWNGLLLSSVHACCCCCC